jgi:hypothetical protein
MFNTNIFVNLKNVPKLSVSGGVLHWPLIDKQPTVESGEQKRKTAVIALKKDRNKPLFLL